MSPEDLYDGIVDNIHDLDAATENARLLYNHLVRGGEAPDRPSIPASFTTVRRASTAVQSTMYPGSLLGLATLCGAINSLTGMLR